VATALAPKLTGAENRRLKKKSTSDAEAFRLYLRGRYCWEQRTDPSLRRAIHVYVELRSFDKALEQFSGPDQLTKRIYVLARSGFILRANTMRIEIVREGRNWRRGCLAVPFAASISAAQERRCGDSFSVSWPRRTASKAVPPLETGAGVRCTSLPLRPKLDVRLRR
jgi:hypothetical protein